LWGNNYSLFWFIEMINYQSLSTIHQTAFSMKKSIQIKLKNLFIKLSETVNAQANTYFLSKRDWNKIIGMLIMAFFISFNAYSHPDIDRTDLFQSGFLSDINQAVIVQEGGDSTLFSNYPLNNDNNHDTGLVHEILTKNVTNGIQPDGFLLINNKLVMIKQGIIVSMTDDIRLKNGSKVLRQGYVVRPGGYIILINEGEYLDMTGKIQPINKSDILLE
jgi:hypothetical protein